MQFVNDPSKMFPSVCERSPSEVTVDIADCDPFADAECASEGWEIIGSKRHLSGRARRHRRTCSALVYMPDEKENLGHHESPREPHRCGMLSLAQQTSDVSLPLATPVSYSVLIYVGGVVTDRLLRAGSENPGYALRRRFGLEAPSIVCRRLCHAG